MRWNTEVGLGGLGGGWWHQAAEAALSPAPAEDEPRSFYSNPNKQQLLRGTAPLRQEHTSSNGILPRLRPAGNPAHPADSNEQLRG